MVYICCMLTNLKISNRGFWDVDFSQLDEDLHSEFIISRVFNYGKWNDIISVIKHYGEQRVMNHLLNTQYLTESALHLASTIFKQNSNKFSCSTNKQFPHSS